MCLFDEKKKKKGGTSAPQGLLIRTPIRGPRRIKVEKKCGEKKDKSKKDESTLCMSMDIPTQNPVYKP